MTNKDFYKRIGCVCVAIIGMFALFILAVGFMYYISSPTPLHN